MKYSTPSFTCGMITLTTAVMDFVFNNPIAGWVLLGVTVIIFTFAYFTYKNEKNNGPKLLTYDTRQVILTSYNW